MTIRIRIPFREVSVIIDHPANINECKPTSNVCLKHNVYTCNVTLHTMCVRTCVGV